MRQHNSHTTTRHLLPAQHPTPIHPTLPSVIHVLPQVITPLLKVLHSLHQLGIVHRDIKPENIFFQADGTLRLGDFGLAINASKERPVSRVGTLEYMAPEVTTEAAQASTTPYCSTASCPQPVLCKIRFDTKETTGVKANYCDCQLMARPFTVLANRTHALNLVSITCSRHFCRMCLRWLSSVTWCLDRSK